MFAYYVHDDMETGLKSMSMRWLLLFFSLFTCEMLKKRHNNEQLVGYNRIIVPQNQNFIASQSVCRCFFVDKNFIESFMRISTCFEIRVLLKKW